MIDPRASIDPKAEVAEDVEIGPFSIIGPDVTIGPGTRVGPHVVINGPTQIGSDNQFYQFSSIGDAPQDKKYAGEPTLLEIGDRNVVREYCTINRGTVQDRGATTIGNDNWIMAYVHIAHDCVVGDHTIFANAASLAGHVYIGDHAILGGFSIVHQFCMIGAHSFSAMGSVISKDVPPYVMVSGHPAKPHGINSEGLKRRGFSSEAVSDIRRAYKALYKSGLKLEQAREHIAELASGRHELKLLDEFLAAAKRGIIR